MLETGVCTTPPTARPPLRAFPRLVMRRFGGWLGFWRRREDASIPAGAPEALYGSARLMLTRTGVSSRPAVRPLLVMAWTGYYICLVRRDGIWHCINRSQ